MMACRALRPLVSAMALFCSVASLTSGASAAEATCRDTVSARAVASESVAAHASIEAARAAAIRRALIEAMQQASGVEVATSFSSVESATLNRVEQETQEKTLARSRARMMSWTIESEGIGEDLAGGSLFRVALAAQICKNPPQAMPEIVAFASVTSSGDVDTRGYREILSSLFPQNERYEVILDQPSQTYYDLLVSGRVLATSANLRDQTQDIEALGRFLPQERLAAMPTRVLRVSVRVMVKAEGFMGTPALIEIAELSRDAALDTNPVPTINDLALEAFRKAAKSLYERLLANS